MWLTCWSRVSRLLLNVVKFTSIPQSIRRSESSLLLTLILICHFFQTAARLSWITLSVCVWSQLSWISELSCTALCNVWIMMLADAMLLNDYHCFGKSVINTVMDMALSLITKWLIVWHFLLFFSGNVLFLLVPWEEFACRWLTNSWSTLCFTENFVPHTNSDLIFFYF